MAVAKNVIGWAKEKGDPGGNPPGKILKLNPSRQLLVHSGDFVFYFTSVYYSIDDILVASKNSTASSHTPISQTPATWPGNQPL